MSNPFLRLRSVALVLSSLLSLAGLTRAQAPVADFSGVPTTGVAPLTVAFSDFTTGSVTSWSWTFGDGGTSTDQDPSYTYVTPGTYTVTLSATGPGGTDGETKTDYIVVTEPPPIADFSGAPLSGPAPLSVTFTNLSSGGLATGGTWDFGDLGTSTAISPTHVYTTPGTYTVSLTATGPGGVDTETKVGYVVVSEPAPVAEFSGTPINGPAPLAANFTDLSTGMVTSWAWDFGDGGSSTMQNPMYTYSSVGTYTVSLIATGPGGSDTETKIDYVVVGEPAPVADFSASPLSGDASLAVTFTDLTSGAVTGWSWDFGDGGASTLQNPSHTYTTAGIYTVTLVATGPGGSDTETKFDYVTVTVPAPVAAFFGTPLTGTSPHTVNFTDLSANAVTSWAWSFGDATTSSLENPTHSYSTPGTYTVGLTVTGPGGVSTHTETDYVVVLEPPPVTQFSGSPRTGVAPLTVDFTDFSSGNVIGWSWAFGDGGTSTVQNPSHTYTAAGTYTVSLTATTSGGSNTATKVGYIVVNSPPPVADFSGSPVSGTTPLVVAFSDLSTGAVTSWSWDFGDLGTSSLQNPSHTYSGAGTYTVSLTTTGPGGVDTQTKVGYITVTDLPPVADFIGTPLSGAAPLTTSFTDKTTGSVTSWDWDFGDGGTSTAQNPTYTFAAPGTYTVALTSTGPGGSNTKTRVGYVLVATPTPVSDFTGMPLSGVAPLTVTFTNASTGAISGQSWAFGDGGTSTAASPSHTYTAAGNYTVALTSTGPGGSHTKTRFEYVVVSEPAPVANFSGTPLTGVSPLSVSFSDLSTGMVTGWSWSFGDGYSSAAQDPAHTYSSPGTYTVTLTAIGPGGTDTHTEVGYVVVNEPPPVAQFSGVPLVGVAPLTVDFTDYSSGNISSWSWTFGDGGTSTLESPSHTYTTPGAKTVSLNVTSSGGSDTETKIAYVTVLEPAPIADFMANPVSGATPLTVDFTDTSTGGSVTSWMWNFGDNTTSTLQNPSHTYSVVGVYTVSLTVSGPGGTNTITKVNHITVGDAPPVADFSGAPLSGIAPYTVNFTDLSAGVVTSWAWDFGDGDNDTAQHPSHAYTVPGTYTVSLTASGPGGMDTETKVGYVTVIDPPPVADFSGTPVTGVLPLSVDFTDLTTGAVTGWSWDFGDLGTSSAQNPSHTYTSAGTYSVSLTSTGPGGSDTETKVSYITVSEQPPIANFSGTPLVGVAPLTVSFTNTTTGGPVTSRLWDFGDSGTSTAVNPTHVYLSPGTYTVTLTATGPGGSDSEVKVDYIVVNEPPPIAEFSGSPLTGSLPLTVNFTDISGGVISSWSWSFGDGGTSTVQNPSHTYLALGSYTVSLTVMGPGGVDSETKFDYVVAGSLPALSDGSFELQTAGTAPTAPWSITSGAGHVISPSGVASDNGFPSKGSKWVELGADGTVAATPPSNPTGNGTPPVGAAGISQSFAYPSGSPHLAFDAAFIMSGVQNDFMSIDITDGSTTRNLYFRNSTSAFPNTSTKYLLPMTSKTTIITDLSTAFPTSSPTTIFTLTLQVGNATDGLDPSKGYVDNIRLLNNASATIRNGTGVNDLCYSNLTPPAIGTTWSVQVDHSGHPGATFTTVIGQAFPATIPSIYGEILIQGPKYFQSTKPATGTAVTHSFPLPNDISLIGLPAATQGVILGGVGPETCNAIDIVVGF